MELAPNFLSTIFHLFPTPKLTNQTRCSVSNDSCHLGKYPFVLVDNASKNGQGKMPDDQQL